MRAALYARVSREEQAEGYSLDSQLEAMRQFCADRDWEIVVEYVEPGFTATTDQRPVFGQLMADVRDRPFDVVLTHKLDRAFRSLLDQLQRLAYLTEYDTSYVSVVEQIDYSTPVGKMFMAMLGALNQYYSDNLAEEVKKGKRGRAKAGRSNARRPPWGYTRVDGQDVIDEEKRPVVEAVFQMFATDAYSFQGLAELLNERHPQENRRWTWRNVAYMLRNPFYAGFVVYHGQQYPGQHEALIPLGDYEKIQAIDQERSRRGRQRGVAGPTPSPWLLSGVLVCHRCGSTMWTQGQENRWFYYICSSRRRGGTCPDQSYAPMALVHEQVERLIRQIQLPTDWQQRIVELANYKEEIKDVERARAQVQGNITRLTNAYIWQGTDEETYQAELRQLQGRLARLQVPDTPAVVQAGTYLESLAGLWDDLDDRERREVVHILFQEIRLDVKGKNSKIICVQVKPDFVPLFRLDGMEEGDNGCFYLSGPD